MSDSEIGQKSELDRPTLGSRLVAVGIALVLVALALGVWEVLETVVDDLLQALSLDQSTTARLFLETLLQQGLVFCGISVIYLWIRNLGREWLGVSFPDRDQLWWIVGGWAGVFAATSVLAITVKFLGIKPAKNSIVPTVIDHPEALLMLIPVSFILVATGEELLFRGVIQGSLRERFGPAAAILLSSAIFAVPHATVLTGSLESRLTTVVILFIPSLIFAIAYERTDNLVVPVLIHGLYDAARFTQLYVLITLGGAPIGLL